MDMTKVLLIAEDLPSENYGTGQRIKLWQDAIERVGECRILHLALPGSATDDRADYSAPMVFDYRAGGAKWLWWQTTFGFFRASRRYRLLLQRIQAEFPFDVAVCSFFKTAPAAPLDRVPCILDVDALLWPSSRLSRMIWPLTKWFMRRRAAQFDKVVVIAKSEGDILASPSVSPLLLPGASVSVRQSLCPSMPRGRNVLFVGPRNWPPNGDAIDWLISTGVPQRLHEAGYVLRLVGSGTETVPDMPGLIGAGFVDDLAQEYADAAVVLCPIESGAGANIKLAEAIQYGCAVIASTHSARPYEGVLSPGVHLLTYSDPAAFADLLLTSLHDEALLTEYRKQAIGAAKSQLSPELLAERMVGWISEALNGRRMLHRTAKTDDPKHLVPLEPAEGII